MSEEQMEEGKCMGHMPPRFGTSSEKAGTDAHEADAVLQALRVPGAGLLTRAANESTKGAHPPVLRSYRGKDFRQN